MDSGRVHARGPAVQKLLVPSPHSPKPARLIRIAKVTLPPEGEWGKLGFEMWPVGQPETRSLPARIAPVECGIRDPS